MKFTRIITYLICFFSPIGLFSQSTWCCWNGLEFTFVSKANAESEMNAADLIQSQTSSFDLSISDATTNGPLPENTGMVVSVTFSNVMINATVTQLYQRFGMFGDIVNERWGIAYKYDIPYANGIKAVNMNYSNSSSVWLTIPVDAGLTTENINDKFLSDYYTYTVKGYVSQFDAKVEIRAANYEPRTVFLTNVKLPSYFDEIGLVQQINNVNLKGSINVNNVNTSNSDTNDSSSKLDILTPKQIADALGLSENDVVDLIIKQQLKAKKIGDKYFIRKEDFDEFMKK